MKSNLGTLDTIKLYSALIATMLFGGIGVVFTLKLIGSNPQAGWALVVLIWLVVQSVRGIRGDGLLADNFQNNEWVLFPGLAILAALATLLGFA